MSITRSASRFAGVSAAALLAAALLASGAARAADMTPVVSAQWLNDHLKDVIVLDVRDEADGLTVAPVFAVDKKSGAKFLAKPGGHIAGARFVDFGTIREERTVEGVKLKAMMPTKEFFQKAMDAAGVDKGKPIVISAPAANAGSLEMATRLYFQLKYFGQDQVAILDGGTNGWIQAGLPVSTDAIPAKTGDWAATAERKEMAATTDEVKAALKDKSAQLVDARPTAQYFGLAKSPVVAAGGHLDGAHSLPPEARSVNKGLAAHFLTPAQYKAIFKAQDIDPDKTSIAYCNTGHLASGAWFVQHEIMGEKNVKLYPGSMNEWTNLKNPVVGLPN